MIALQSSLTHPTFRVAETPPRPYSSRRVAVPVAHRVDPKTLHVADRVYHVDEEARWHEGTVIRVDSIENTRLCDILWDDTQDAPAFPRVQQNVSVSVFHVVAWGIILHRIGPDHWSRARRCLFSLGQLVATPGALDVVEQSGTSLLGYLLRHQTGDWGDLTADDCHANAEGLVHGMRIFSAYPLSTGHRLWIITEADRCLTTVLLPEEY